MMQHHSNGYSTSRRFDRRLEQIHELTDHVRADPQSLGYLLILVHNRGRHEPNDIAALKPFMEHVGAFVLARNKGALKPRNV
jgi:hypothetical protein